MSANAQEKLRLPLVRKVFRQGDLYICGLCKANYHDYGSANSCMNQCWFDIHRFYPVVKRKRSVNAWVFRCLFCCRDYVSEMGAYNCSQRCLDVRNKAQLREQLVNDLPLSPPLHPVSRLIMLTKLDTPVPLPKTKAKAKRISTAPLSLAESKAYSEPLIASQTSEIDSAPRLTIPELKIAEVVIDRGQHKASYKIQVDSHEEGYQCQYCHKTRTTMREGQECFDRHFNEEGFETVPSMDPNA